MMEFVTWWGRCNFSLGSLSPRTLLADVSHRYVCTKENVGVTCRHQSQGPNRWHCSLWGVWSHSTGQGWDLSCLLAVLRRSLNSLCNCCSGVALAISHLVVKVHSTSIHAVKWHPCYTWHSLQVSFLLCAFQIPPKFFPKACFQKNHPLPLPFIVLCDVHKMWHFCPNSLPKACDKQY